MSAKTSVVAVTWLGDSGSLLGLRSFWMFFTASSWGLFLWHKGNVLNKHLWVCIESLLKKKKKNYLNKHLRSVISVDGDAGNTRINMKWPVSSRSPPAIFPSITWISLELSHRQKKERVMRLMWCYSFSWKDQEDSELQKKFLLKNLFSVFPPSHKPQWCVFQMKQPTE